MTSTRTFLLLLLGLLCPPALATTAREAYDSISQMMAGTPYPEVWWEERTACMDSLSPSLAASLDKAWAGMEEYWQSRGGELEDGVPDKWWQCDEYNETRLAAEPCDLWFECNCTSQSPPVQLDIWEPCNYASNLAYDRLMVEMCSQQDWTFSPQTVTKIAEAFGIVTFGSSFMHGSQTECGGIQDTKSNDLFIYILYQAGVANIPYDPIIHDLALTPRNMSGEAAVDAYLDMYNNKPVAEWYALTTAIDIPVIYKSFCGVFGYMFTVLFDPATVDMIIPPLLDLFGILPDDRAFLLDSYLPAIRAASTHYLGLKDRLELLTNLVTTIGKLLYAFVWQENVIDLHGWNLTPEANQIGAALLPYINQYANNQTSWDLNVDDVQNGQGYPGWESCNPVIPHAKWHVQTAASLADMARLMDMLLRMMTQE